MNNDNDLFFASSILPYFSRLPISICRGVTSFNAGVLLLLLHFFLWTASTVSRARTDELSHDI